jgi:hypothetical protein
VHKIAKQFYKNISQEDDLDNSSDSGDDALQEANNKNDNFTTNSEKIIAHRVDV